MSPVENYRRKLVVEAMRWTDTDADREQFAAWFDRHDALFETRGPVALLPDLVTRTDGDHNRVEPGEWIVWTDDEFTDGAFTAMANDEFREHYEEAP